ncbi:MAG: bifunctional phosphoribosylaminoimidazolecarboxamide formyltransferase/IMP cyclohydrolase [Fimbriimonadaceae bacterium]|nr:bifunctional phosphoribosylaminoimidazolecarboxamide formyltransferase/IMP cyclohydrolase [Fimbriimonadaceae bacterium]
MPRALLSVTDKSDLVPFAQSLAQMGFELVSTGGTATALRDAGLKVIDVSEVTGFPEMLDGRLKTLHPLVHGGLLGDLRKQSHGEAMAAAGIVPVDLLVVNLYAFEKTVTGEHTEEGAIESIDIGGPAMIRAAAKNSANVLVVVDPEDYGFLSDALLTSTVTPTLRKRMMAKAFRHTAFYDSMIARYLGDEDFPETLTMGYRRALSLRYGENPHQNGALYVDPLAEGGIARAKQLWGKDLSYNNLLDGDAAWGLVCDLPAGGCAIIKHGNPCGAALGSTLGESYRIARQSDPISAFGGIAAFNGAVTLEAAEAMTEKGNFLEVVIGTAFDPEAVALFQDRAGWGQNVRLLEAAPAAVLGKTLRSISGGVLVQDVDREPVEEWQTVSNLTPTEDQMAALRFQWTVARHVKSNAIVVGQSDRLLGVGAGQMNRVQSVRLALEQAGEGAKGAVLASDAFFPFPDSVETAAAAGISAVIQPGGSKKDDEVIAAANRLGIAMVLTGVRHFRH